MKKIDFSIRPAISEDAAAIANVNMATRRFCYAPFMPPDFIAANIVTPKRIDNWQQQTAQPECFLYVGETPQSEIIAMAWGKPTSSADIPFPYQLCALYVLPAYQRQGIGRALMEKFAEFAGYQPFYLYMLKNNPVKSFYQKMGGIRHPEYDIQKEWKGYVLEEEAFVFHLQKKS